MSLLSSVVSRLGGSVAGRHVARAAVVRVVAMRNGVQQVSPMLLSMRTLLVDAAALSEAAGKPQEASKNFTAALEKELKFEKENFQGATEDVAHFLKNSKFKIEDVPGSREVYLRSQQDNEEINITFGVLDPDMDLGEEEESRLPIPFTVCITKEQAGKDQGTMTLQCQAESGQVEVLALNINATNAATGQAAEDVSDRDAVYPGPKLGDLDEALQTSLVDYLASRGIDENLGAFIESMYYDKEQREYMKWLADLSTFVKV